MAILTLIKAGNKIYKNKDKIKRYTDTLFEGLIIAKQRLKYSPRFHEGSTDKYS